MVRVLAVSPHLDDAVVSYGARLHRLARSGAEVVVLTVFAGVPSPPYSEAAQRYHDVWGVTGNPVPQRVQEDIAALRALDLTPRHADFLDALYRRLPDGGWLVADPTRSVSRQALEVEEPDLMASLEVWISDFAADYRPDVVFTCAAIGRHVDHWRARDATVGALASTGIELRLWEDLPYGGRASEMPPLPAGVSLTERVVEQVGPIDRDAKFSAVQHYVSQLDLLARDGASLRERLSRHARTRSRTAYNEATWGLTSAEATG
ncbi:PIG-L deacetylase family protein [Streptomyces microflavus]|uniref:PIG-L deacetylase family protein n=1 Tax=Streptomyces microflavus TaxID=1919 RepID=UPI0037CF02A7